VGQEELAHTQTDLVMYRQRMHDLIQLVASGTKPQLYLDGPRGECAQCVCAFPVLLAMLRMVLSTCLGDCCWPSVRVLLEENCTLCNVGSGKSIMMAVLAEWGRTSGRVVVYVPSASLFMDGGMYHKCSSSSYSRLAGR
jgi:hypothetical protein